MDQRDDGVSCTTDAVRIRRSIGVFDTGTARHCSETDSDSHDQQSEIDRHCHGILLRRCIDNSIFVREQAVCSAYGHS